MGRSRSTLMGSGFASLAAVAMTGTAADSLTAAGTNQGNAALISSDNNYFTTVASGTGAILGMGDTSNEVIVVNLGANALLVYPPVGGQINALSVNTGFSIAAGKVCKFIARPGGLLWVSLLSA